MAGSMVSPVAVKIIPSEGLCEWRCCRKGDDLSADELDVFLWLMLGGVAVDRMRLYF